MKVQDLFLEKLTFVFVEDKKGKTYSKYEPDELVHYVLNDIQGNHLKLNRIYVRTVVKSCFAPFYEAIFEVEEEI